MAPPTRTRVVLTIITGGCKTASGGGPDVHQAERQWAQSVAGPGSTQCTETAFARGNGWCWCDDLAHELQLTFDRCCQGDLGDLQCWSTVDREGRALTSEWTGVFSMVKCCDRTAHTANFFGFANPTVHRHSPEREGSWTAMTMDFLGMRLSLPQVPFSLWALVHDSAEPPRQVAWELGNFERHREEFTEAFEARRAIHRRGWKPCSEPFERFDVQVVLDNAEVVRRLFSALGGSPVASYINIGANDGISDDPLGNLLQLFPQARAAAVEGDRSLCERHRANLPHVHLWCGIITPENIWTAVDQWLPSRSEVELSDGLVQVDFLKVDIDSFDCEVVEAFLSGARSARLRRVLRLQPKIILMEVNDGFPPPVQYSLLFDRSLLNTSLEHKNCSGNIPLAGCSLSYQVAHFYSFGYRLIMYGSGQATFAHLSVLEAIKAAGFEGPLDEFECYWNTLLVGQCVSGRQIRRWSHEIGGPAGTEQILAEVRGHLLETERRFSLPRMRMALEV